MFLVTSKQLINVVQLNMNFSLDSFFHCIATQSLAKFLLFLPTVVTFFFLARWQPCLAGAALGKALLRGEGVMGTWMSDNIHKNMKRCFPRRHNINSLGKLSIFLFLHLPLTTKTWYRKIVINYRTSRFSGQQQLLLLFTILTQISFPYYLNAESEMQLTGQVKVVISGTVYNRIFVNIERWIKCTYCIWITYALGGKKKPLQCIENNIVTSSFQIEF